MQTVILDFDTLQQFIESVAELEEHEFIVMGDDVKLAQNALNRIHRRVEELADLLGSLEVEFVRRGLIPVAEAADECPTCGPMRRDSDAWVAALTEGEKPHEIET